MVRDGLGLVSTAVAVLVGLTSIYATTQAMRMTQASAQERVFDNQLNAGLSLNAATAAANASHGDLDGAIEGLAESPSPARLQTLRSVLEVDDTRYAELHQEVLKLRMLMPDRKAYTAAADALDVHFEINHAAWAVLERGTITPAERAQISANEDKEGDLLLKATDICSDHISAIVAGKGRVR